MKAAANLTDADVPSRTVGWPRSPSTLFGIAAGFFLVMGVIFIKTNLFRVQLPFVSHGEITHVLMGYLWLLIAVPFAAFGLAYAVIEYPFGRKLNDSATRIHFICTIFAIIEAIRVYSNWAGTTSNVHPEVLTAASFGGSYAFMLLAVGAFAWNIFTSKPSDGTTH